MSRHLKLVLLLIVGWPMIGLAGETRWIEQGAWSAEFTSRAVTGTALVYDERDDRMLVFDRARAETRFSPASTFKLFNALVALDTGAVADEFEVLRWDGVKRRVDEWNRDQNLASAMKVSAVWFYQEMARRAGAARMQEWIDRVGYGNRDIGGGIDRFWLDGALRISAVEQIGFLRRLAAGTLPFSARAQETVRRISIIEDAPNHVLHGKTGWAVRADTGRATDLGWIVGWVERDGRRWFYAVNLDLHDTADAGKRIAIARALLSRSGALPATP